MDFALSDEQQMIEETVIRFVEDRYPLTGRWDGQCSPPAFDASRWAELAELGLLGLLVPEARGGIGGGTVELMVVARALGRRLATDPYVSTAAVAARLLASGIGAALSNVLADVVAGRTRVVVACLEPDSRYDVTAPATTATRTAGGWRISGAKSAIVDAQGATHILVSATIGERPHEIGLFALPCDCAGVDVVQSATFDGRAVADCHLRDAVCPTAMTVADANGLERLTEALDWGVTALCAEATGAMRALIEQTVDYLRVRHQFGQPIGRFQALQHRLAEMENEAERAAAITLHAVAHLDSPDPSERIRAVSAAKTIIGEAGRFIGEQAVQLHGGIGVTDALAIGHYLKRLTAIELTWGDGDHHLSRFIACAEDGR